MNIDFKGIIKEAIKSKFDELNRFLGIIFLIFLVLSIFIRNFFIDIIPFILFGLILFRTLSSNKVQRNKENRIYLSIINFFTKPFKYFKEKDFKNNVYKKCPKCKTTLKLPLPAKSGINHAKCPNCGNRVTVINIRHKKKEKIKVEKIKKRKDT